MCSMCDGSCYECEISPYNCTACAAGLYLLNNSC